MKDSKEQSLDELNLLRAKLYKARAEGVSLLFLYKHSVLTNSNKFYFNKFQFKAKYPNLINLIFPLETR